MAENTSTAVSDVHKKIKAAFEAFDYQSNSTVDVRSVGLSLPPPSSAMESPPLCLTMDSRKSEGPLWFVSREIGTIVYSLGCFPSRTELHDFLTEVGEDHTGCVHLDRFLPAMTEVLMENRFPPVSEVTLLQAFEVLDKEKKGYLESEELTKYLTQEGEPFSQEEMDEMLTALSDNDKNRLYYTDYISQLTSDLDA